MLKIQWALMPPLTGLEDLGIAVPSMYMYRCVQLYLVPIPHDPNRVYMCLCLLSSKTLGIEESEYVYIYICVE